VTGGSNERGSTQSALHEDWWEEVRGKSKTPEITRNKKKVKGTGKKEKHLAKNCKKKQFANPVLKKTRRQ